MKIDQIFSDLESRRPMNTMSNNSFISITDLATTLTPVNWGGSISAVPWGVQRVSDSPALDTGRGVVRLVRRLKLFGITLKKHATEVPVDVFFEKVKKSKKKIAIIDGIVDKYLASIAKAEKFGQTALVEKLKDDIEVVKKEALAASNGVTEYLTEDQVQKLLQKTSRNIEVDFIKNFARHIPDKLLETIEKLRKENCFDDYVVMHYDPKKKNTELTKKEKERKRDPILFGIIRDSRNFYYIGDWVDEYCDLTLKEAIAIIEEKPKSVLK